MLTNSLARLVCITGSLHNNILKMLTMQLVYPTKHFNHKHDNCKIWRDLSNIRSQNCNGMLKGHVQIIITMGMMYLRYIIITTSPSLSYVNLECQKQVLQKKYQDSFTIVSILLWNAMLRLQSLQSIIFRPTQRVVPLACQATFLSVKQEISFPFLFLFSFC